MEFLQEYINEMSKQHQQLIDDAVVDLLRKEGFEIYEPIAECVKGIAATLELQKRHVRCEVFYKPALEESRFTMSVLPFIESIEYPLPRAEIYRILGLQEQGYIL